MAGTESCRRSSRRQKWTVWLAGVLLTYAFQNADVRPFVYLKSLEEYRRTALPAGKRAQ